MEQESPRPAPSPAWQEQQDADAQRGRAERLEAELALSEGRLFAAEQLRAGDAAVIAEQQDRLRAFEREGRTWISKLARPLMRVELAFAWIAGKALRVGGVAARHLVFRSRRNDK